MLLQTLKCVSESFISLLYPPFCIHCGEDVVNKSQYLCPTCSELMELIDPTTHCPRCFSKNFQQETLTCFDCINQRCMFTRSAATFEYLGPAGTIIKKMKYGEMPYLAKGAAAYMVTQILRLGWPMPDKIIPVPLSFSHSLSRGYNQSELLAKEMSGMMSTERVNALKRVKGGYSQAALKRVQREKMPKDTFQLRRKIDIVEQSILLVDDVYTTGRTLKCCAEALCEGYPKEIYAITFCRAL